ncbi:MAG: hypothetical protein D3922_03445 [Candidatus Electrothrix sp. AR1]|nr:hypothetical protein [Candidatus Electrothrix sp. AR1]
MKLFSRVVSAAKGLDIMGAAVKNFCSVSGRILGSVVMLISFLFFSVYFTVFFFFPKEVL